MGTGPYVNIYEGTQAIPAGRRNGAVWALDDGIVVAGGYGRESVASAAPLLGDVWRYRRATNTWTNLFRNRLGSNYGPTGILTPGARANSAYWVAPTDQTKLYIFGGYYDPDVRGFDWNFMSDLWVFDLVTNTWSFLGGSKANRAVMIENGPAAWPSGREGSQAFVGSDGLAYLYGGRGITTNASAVPGKLNDLWTYDMLANVWVRVSGNTALDTLNTADFPGGRKESVVWPVCGGFYVFGGVVGPLVVAYSDLWRYEFATRTWYQEWPGSGSALSVYLTQGTPNLCAYPGSRNDLAGWMTDSSALWLYGGNGFVGDVSVTKTAYMSDTWRLSIPSTQELCVVATTTSTPPTTPFVDIATTTPPVAVGDSFPVAAVVVPIVLILLILLILLAVLLYRRKRATDRAVFYVGSQGDNQEWGRNPFHRTNANESHMDMAEILDAPVASPVSLSVGAASSAASSGAFVGASGTASTVSAPSPSPQGWEESGAFEDFL